MYFLAFDFGILLSLNLIFYIILGFAILAGFFKGLKKSLFTFMTMAIFYVLFFVTLNFAVNILWNANLSFLGPLLGNNLDSSLANFTSFADGYESILQVLLGEEVDLSQMSGEFLELSMGIMLFALKIVWTILYFTVILILYKIICLIIRAIFFKNKEGANKMRGFGALVGAANGLMAIFITLIVMGGMISVVDSMSVLISEVNATQDETETLSYIPRENIYQANYSLLAEVDPETTEPMLEEAIAMMEQMVEEYNSNLFVMLANKIEVESVIDEDVLVPMHINLFDSVLSFDYNENTVAFRYELMVLSDAFVIFLNSDFQETNEITDLKGDEIRDIFQVIANSKLVVSVVPLAIEYASERYDQDLPIEVEELYDGSIDFEEELATLGRIGGALFDILNGAGFIGGEGSVDQIEVTGENVRELFTDISGSDIILLITESLLLPMLENPEGEDAFVLNVPDDLDLEAEFLALGEIFAEIIEADINFDDVMGDDITTTLAAISSIDLTVLLDSRLVTEALISILTGEGGMELDMFTIPTDVVWHDSESTEGELRKILEALNALLEISDDLDLENLDIGFITDMDEAAISTFFDSYVIRATVSDIFSDLDLGDMPLIFPDVIYDDMGYFTRIELISTITAVKLIIDTSGTETTFDPTKVLQLTNTEIDDFLESNIIYATIGNYFNTIDTSEFVIPDSVNTTILVNELPENVVTKTELKNLFKALSVLELTEFSGFSFDATFLEKFENTAGDDIDSTKVSTLLGSEIIHATVSSVIVDLDKSQSGPLVVPLVDVDNDPILTQVATVDYIDKTEIYSVFRALYYLEITDFNNVSLEDTAELKDNFTELMNSAIIHATVSDVINNIGSSIVIPNKDFDNQDVIVIRGTTSYITKAELEDLVDGLVLLGVTDPNAFSEFSFSTLNTDVKRTELLKSAILHATISDQLLGLGSSLLFVPEQDEDGVDLIIERGTPAVDYVVKTEIKAIIAAMIAMGYQDVNDLDQEIDAQVFIDNMNLVLESASMQATVSDMILSSAATSLIVPDLDASSQPLRIEFTDVTYINSTELENFFISIDLFQIPNLDFDSFSVGPNDIQTIDKNTFFNSYIMQATVSDYFLDVAGDETAAVGTTTLLVPTTKRISITVDSTAQEIIEKTEMINMLEGFSTLGLTDYSAAFDANTITALTSAQIDTILLSDSLHVTVDNMMRSNVNISGSIPALAEDITTYTITITIKSAVKNFILATQQFSGVNFTNVTFDYATIASMTPAQRDIVLDSMIVRNILTPELENLGTTPPFNLDPYVFVASDYMNSDPLTFLTEAGINAVFTHYGLV